MAITQNTYTGDGATVLFSFTFPYLDATDIKVTVNGTPTTAYTLANATTVQFTTAPANGAAVRIYRVTDDDQLAASFYPGSAIRSQDLNENFTQGIYIAQEATRDVAEATAQVSSAVTTANTASANAAAAVSTANTAAANAAAAVSTANSALSTANAASSSASNAVSTANSAASAASAATSTANTAAANASAAVSTANTAASNASTALSTANSAASDASTALSTANTAASNASTALSTANTALSNSSSALTTAGNADVKADAAIAAVASSVNYTGVANVAAIPSSPANNTYIEVADATGLESFTPLAGMPVGFVGDSGLRVRLRYTTTGSTWNWIDYFPTDADARYVQETAISDSVVTTSSTSVASSTAVKAAMDAADSAASAASAAQSTANTAVSNAAAAQSTANQAVSDAAAAQSTANAALPKSGGTMTGNIGFAGTQTFPAASTSAPGVVQLSDSTNSASSTTAATSAAVKSVQDFAQVVSTTANAAMPKAGGTFTGTVTHESNNTGIANASGGLTKLEVRGTGGAAFMSFHRPGAHAAYLGLDTDNQFRVGGWSMGAASYPLLHSNNFNSYAPTLTGGNASGTWNININGRGYPREANGGDMNFYWSGQGGQPSWLWGSNDGTNMYVWNPSNFSVNYANVAGSLGGQGFQWIGSYALARMVANTTVPANDLVAGSNLRYAGGNSSGTLVAAAAASHPGTWRNMSILNSQNEYSLYNRVA